MEIILDAVNVMSEVEFLGCTFCSPIFGGGED